MTNEEIRKRFEFDSKFSFKTYPNFAFFKIDTKTPITNRFLAVLHDNGYTGKGTVNNTHLYLVIDFRDKKFLGIVSVDNENVLIYNQIPDYIREYKI